jgi:hypothetical protein
LRERESSEKAHANRGPDAKWETPAQSQGARLFLSCGIGYPAKSPVLDTKIEDEGDGQLPFFICAHVWLEKHFSRGGYKKSGTP